MTRKGLGRSKWHCSARRPSHKLGARGSEAGLPRDPDCGTLSGPFYSRGPPGGFAVSRPRTNNGSGTRLRGNLLGRRAFPAMGAPLTCSLPPRVPPLPGLPPASEIVLRAQLRSAAWLRPAAPSPPAPDPRPAPSHPNSGSMAPHRRCLCRRPPAWAAWGLLSKS